MNKKGVELSINFLIILILSLAVLASGIFFASKLLGTAIDMKQDLDESSKMEIENMLIEGVRVGIPFKSQKVERGKSVYYGLGILNVYPHDNFRISVTFSDAFDLNYQQI